MKRVITGLLLTVFLIFLLIYVDAFWFFIAVALTVGLALSEYYRITIGQEKGLLLIGTLLGVAVPVVIYSFGLKGFEAYLLFVVFIIFAYCLFIQKEIASVSKHIGIVILGIIYIALFLSHLILLRGLEDGSLWILFLVFIISANDTFAYYTGRKFGKRKLAPIVSPGKTLEGALGGLVGGMIIATAFQQFFMIKISLNEALMLALLIGIISQFSDLFESLLKRSAGVKDSGNILPGHGGVLDRIDSLIFPIPLLYYYLIVFRV